MKRKDWTWILILLIFFSCSEDGDNSEAKEVTVNFTFSHHWDNESLSNADFNEIKYTTENGDQLSLERLRYLVSRITFERSNGESIEFNSYYLVDVGNGTGLSFSALEAIPEGDYSNLSFTFGFNNEDNEDGVYPDLNAVLWNVPEMLGGGYHYMQLEGKFVDDSDMETGYQYHAIRAVNITVSHAVFQDTFFTVDLGPVTVSDRSEFDIRMNVAEWFKNPNLWDLNALHSMMMPNFGAQIMISENGKNAFDLAADTN